MISNSGHDEKNKYTGGAAGDQTGNEWTTRKWYSRPWACVLRYEKNKRVPALIAEMAEAAAKNNKIGYDQWQRLTFWQELKKAEYNPALIGNKCEADCSAGVMAIVKAAGYRLNNKALQGVNVNDVCRQMRADLVKAGFTCLTAKKYLISDEYLLPGDILLNDHAHTCINLTAGKKAMQEPENKPQKEAQTVDITLNILKKGDKNPQVGTVQTILKQKGIKGADKKALTIDGDFGANTEHAVKSFQKENQITADGVVGAVTWNKLIKG